MKKDSMLRYYNRRILIWSLAAICFLALVVTMLILMTVNPANLEDAGFKVLHIMCSLLLGISLGRVVVLTEECSKYKKELK